MTQASIAAFGLLALAVVAVLASLLTKIHTDVVPGIKVLLQDGKDIRDIAASARETAALAQQQSRENTARLNGQSAKLDAVGEKVGQVVNALFLNTPAPAGGPGVAPPGEVPAVVAPAPAGDPPAPPALPPEVLDTLNALSAHTQAMTAAVSALASSTLPPSLPVTPSLSPPPVPSSILGPDGETLGLDGGAA